MLQNRYINPVPAKYQPIFRAAMQRFALGERTAHGPAHWLKVFENAELLARETTGADIEVCLTFALLHDCERQNENHDPQHGPRAADRAMAFHQAGLLTLSDQQMLVLCEACRDHASGRTIADATIGVCWDADRLDLPRVGMVIDRRFLSTAAAKALPWF